MNISVKTAVFLCLVCVFFGFAPAYSQTPVPSSRPLESIRVSANGKRMTLKMYRDSTGNFLIPAKDVDTGIFLKNFGATITWLEPMNTVVMGLPGGKDFRIRAGDKTGEFGGRTVNLTAPVQVIDGVPCVPLECIETAYRLKAVMNDETHVLYLDPIITSAELVRGRDMLSLVAQGTAPLTYRTSKLGEPDRFVIDIDNAVLDSSLSSLDLRHSRLGSIFVSQESLAPNVVRIVIPIKNDVEMEMDTDNKDNTKVVALMVLPHVLAPVQDMDSQRITGVDLVEEKGKVSLTLSASGPIQYEWRRLLPPDNRFFVDIPKATLNMEPVNRALDAGFISGFEVYQLKSDPEPVVRVMLKLEIPCRVSMAPSSDKQGALKIDIFEKTISTGNSGSASLMERQGFGVTEFRVQKGIIIVIDPGHGGGDPGACNSSCNLQEKEVNLDIALRLSTLLKNAGWNVVMTRNTDRDVSYLGSSDGVELGARASVANSINADIFLSIHNNASVNSSACGTSTHCCKPVDYPLANKVHNNMMAVMGRQDNGVRTDRFYVVRNTSMPAVLVECAYVSNPAEASLLCSDGFRQKCAVGIFNGLMEYANMMGLTARYRGGSPGTEAINRQIEEKRKRIDEKIQRNDSTVSPDDYGEK